ncbi:MAG: cell division protein FtsZ [Flavobacteriales bacterium]|nr:cell division protein FtsZ [Flavobacteriales bacterium]
MNFNLPKEESSIIKVIGVGGGGSNAVNHMYRQGIRGVDFVVCNTDQQALDMSPVPRKIALGSSLTEGRGAGAQAEVGRNAAIETLDEIKEVLGSNTKMVFITAGMGGGTGTGAAPVIAEAARELGILTVGIVTVPFAFEGKKRKIQADKGLEELKRNVDTVLVICNDKLREMYGNLKLGEAFSQADDILTIAAKGIAEIITVEGYVNVDFEDVRTVMTNSGVAIMGSASASGPSRATEAVTRALASPLLNDNNIFGASNILLYISSGTDEVTMDEVTEITDFIQEEAGMTADIIWGNGYDEALGDAICITVIATGFTNEKTEEIQGRENRVVHQLTEDRKAPATPVATNNAGSTLTSRPDALTARPVLLNTPHQEPKAQPSDLFAQKTADRVVFNLSEETPESTIVAEPVAEVAQEVECSKDVEVLSEVLFDGDDELEEERFVAQQLLEVEQVIDEDIVMEQEEEATFFSDEKATEVELELPVQPTAEKEHKVTFNLYEVDEQPVLNEVAESNDEGLQMFVRASTPNEPFKSDELDRIYQERMTRLKANSARFREPRNLAELEQEPAYKRRNVNLADVPHSSESSVSKLALGEKEDEEGNRKGGLSGNSFLHESVD